MSSVQQLFPTGSFGSVSATNSVVTGAATVGSLILPTSGGTATPLTYNEVYTNAAFVWNTGTGYQQTSVTISITLQRIGNIVVLHIPAFTVLGNGGAGSVFVSSNLPARFMPSASNVNTAQYVVLNGTGSTNGMFVLNYLGTVGAIAACAGIAVNPFGATNNSTYGLATDTYLCWTIN